MANWIFNTESKKWEKSAPQQTPQTDPNAAQSITTQQQVTAPQQVTPEQSAVQKAQAAYDEALKRKDELANTSISSYQDIINRYGPPETREDAQAREAKDKRKRDLLAMIQLGGNIGNMINATTGGQMGSRQVEQPNLVKAYDEARKVELTDRMKRDDIRNSARQNMMRERFNAAQGELNNASKVLIEAQRAEQKQREQEAKDNAAKLKADRDDARQRERLASQEKIAGERNKLQWAQHNENKNWHKVQEENQKALQDIRKEELKLKQSNGGKGSAKIDIPVLVDGKEHNYHIPEAVLKNPVTVGSIASCLAPPYDQEFANAKSVAAKQVVIGKYLQDEKVHKGETTGIDSEGKSYTIDRTGNFAKLNTLLEKYSTFFEEDEGGADVADDIEKAISGNSAAWTPSFN